MTDIDWSKAPEGATHYTPANETECINAVYWRVIEGVFVKAWAVLGNGSLSECKSGREFDLTRPDVVTRPWTGDGLPPVGTVCEYRLLNVRYVSEFVAVEVLAHGAEKCFLRHAASQNEFTELLSGVEFRPIRTPEQIAAEEREAAIAQMKECFDSVSDRLMPTSNWYLETLFGALHDAGYRKTEGGAQ